MISAKIMEISSIDGETAKASADNLTQDIRLDIIDTKPVLGDRVVVHAGFALHRVDEAAEEKALNLIYEIVQNDLE
jgi:hydrogenase expression/formation protein HypC